MMRLWLIVAVAVLVVFLLWRRTVPPRRAEEGYPQLPPGEVELHCPACGHDRWRVRGRLSPQKALVLSCSACGRTVTFQGDMERVDHHPSRPKEG
jgi:transcription elongation factor Elf1